MNWFDIFVVILLLRTSYIGFKNGLSAEVYKAAGFVLSALAAFYFHKKLFFIITQYMVTSIQDTQLDALGFLTILLISMLILKFAFVFVQKITQLGFAKNFNTAVGMIFGLGRGVLIACLIFMLLNCSAVDYIKQSVQEKSFSGPYIIKINSRIKGVLTEVRFEAKRHP